VNALVLYLGGLWIHFFTYIHAFVHLSWQSLLTLLQLRWLARPAVHNFSAFSSGLRRDDVLKISQETGRLLKNMRQVVGEAKREHMVTKLSHTLAATTTTLNEIQPFMHDLGQKGGESLEKMDILLLKMQRLTDNLNVVRSDVSELMPELPGLARESRLLISLALLQQQTQHKTGQAQVHAPILHQDMPMDVYLTAARLAHLQGRLPDAKQAYHHLIAELDAENPETIYMLSQAYMGLALLARDAAQTADALALSTQVYPC